jgi:hypothetical protein
MSAWSGELDRRLGDKGCAIRANRAHVEVFDSHRNLV